MNTKTKTIIHTAAAEPRLVYKPAGNGWGMTALFEDYRLTFSGGPDSAGLKAKISAAFNSGQEPKTGPVGSVDLYRLFSPDAKNAWQGAWESAKKRDRAISLEDIFLALLKEPSVKNLLSRMKVNTQAAQTLLTNYLKLTPPSGSDTAKIIPFMAFAFALKLHNHKIGSLMLLGALLKAAPRDNILQAIFVNVGLTLEKLEPFAVWTLDLNYEFPPLSSRYKLLYCLRQAQGLEEHFGYFFEAPAIEAAIKQSAGQTFTDLEHKKALQILVRAGQLAQGKGTKVISESLVRQATV